MMSASISPTLYKPCHVFRILLFLFLVQSHLLTRNRSINTAIISLSSFFAHAHTHAHAVPDPNPNPQFQSFPRPGPDKQGVYIVLDVGSTNTDSLHFAVDMYKSPIFTSNGFVTGSERAFGLHTLLPLSDELVDVVGARVENGPDGVICYVSRHAYDGKGGFSRKRPYEGYMKAKYVACVM